MNRLRRLQSFVLLGALLLLGMEPLVGRLILPAGGGSFQVWATCLMFFQGALFLGYLYCHLLGRRLGRAHLLVILLPLLFVPIGRGLGAIDPNPENPAPAILLALALSIGVPFAVLATTGVMGQRWLADSDLPERDNPYQLFAASNLGSLLALLGYPLLVEPLLGLGVQRWVWTGAFVVYVALAFAAAPSTTPTPAPAEPAEPALPSSPPPPWSRYAFWALLAAAPSACLVAVTNAISIDVGSIPLVWVIPLVLYLLTFVLTFGRRERYPRALQLYWPETLALGLLFWVAWSQPARIAEVGGIAHLSLGAAVHLLILLVVCWVGHAELYRDRPDPEHLTGFYLCVSLGGWIGGAFVSLAAPLLFTTLAEYPAAIGLLAATLAAFRWKALVGYVRQAPRARIALSSLIVVLSLVQAARLTFDRPPATRVRTFYGIYQVEDALNERSFDPIRAITHGTTTHGKELKSPGQWGVPIGYFHAASPLGEVVRLTARPRRIAIVGLGAGALAGHLEPGDQLDFYEIDPAVERLARDHFHYLERARGRVRVITGDARLKLADAPPAGYDLILVDAFSSDAIPIHLLTQEALELYRTKLAPRGRLAFHISTRYYDLRPVLRATSATLDPPLIGAFKSRVQARLLKRNEDGCKAYVLARAERDLSPLLARGWALAANADDIVTIAPWTDDYANLLAALWARRSERD